MKVRELIEQLVGMDMEQEVVFRNGRKVVGFAVGYEDTDPIAVDKLELLLDKEPVILSDMTAQEETEEAYIEVQMYSGALEDLRKRVAELEKENEMMAQYPG